MIATDGKYNLNGLEVQRPETVRALADITLKELKDVVLSLNFRYILPRRKSRLGRRGFSKISLFLAYILYLREQWPHITVAARRIKENKTFQEFCGFREGKTPSHDTLSRSFNQLTEKRLFRLFNHLDEHLQQQGVFDGDELAIDATDVLSNSRNRHNRDPDAGFGYKSDGERFHGYWTIFLVGTTSEVPRDVVVTPANVHQSMTGQVILNRLTPKKRHNAVMFFADAAYDDKKTYHSTIDQMMVPLISYNPKKAKIKKFLKLKRSNWRHKSIGSEGIQLWKKTRYLRGSVERYNATFKQILAGRSVPVRGLYKVTCYVLGVTVLSQLSALASINRKNQKLRSIQMSLMDFLPVIYCTLQAINKVSYS